eukprot:m.206877 g.206877  ORF g.206877 m.206877 type:complete len:665 (-) comp23510_c0_seq1:178-2172(-)
MAQSMEEALECPLCCNPFDDADRIPRALACLHTFCHACLSELGRSHGMQVINCPNRCTPPTTVPNGDVGRLLCNYALKDAIAAYAVRVTSELASDVAGAPAENACEVCEDGTVEHRCVECAELLCSGCAAMHRKMRVSRSHHIQTLAEFLENGPPAEVARSDKVLYCATHPTPKEMHELSLFCRSCDVAICMACTVKDHPKPEHDYTFLKDVAEEQRQSIGAAAAEATARETELVTAVQAVQDMQARVRIRQDDAVATVRRAFERVRAYATEREEEAVRHVLTIMGQKAKQLAAQEDALGVTRASLSSAVEFVNKTMERGSDTEVVMSKPVLLRRLNALAQQHNLLQPVTADDVWLDDDDAELIDRLGRFCTMHDLGIVPANCTVEGLALDHPLYVGAPLRFTVTLRNGRGRPVDVPDDRGGVLNVTVVADNETGVAVPLTREADGEGVFAFTLTAPTDVERVVIHVDVAGTPLAASPFTLEVAPPLGPVVFWRTNTAAAPPLTGSWSFRPSSANCVDMVPSRSVWLHGIKCFCNVDRFPDRCDVKVLDANTHAELASSEFGGHALGGGKRDRIVDLMFDAPALVEAGRRVTLYLHISPAPPQRYMKGSAVAQCTVAVDGLTGQVTDCDLTLTFRNTGRIPCGKSSNSTNATGGQIPGVILALA